MVDSRIVVLQSDLTQSRKERKEDMAELCVVAASREIYATNSNGIRRVLSGTRRITPGIWERAGR